MMNVLLIWALPLFCFWSTGHSFSAVPSSSSRPVSKSTLAAMEILRQAGNKPDENNIGGSPSPAELTRALLEVSRSAPIHKDKALNEVLSQGAKAWKPIFSAKPHVLQNLRKKLKQQEQEMNDGDSHISSNKKSEKEEKVEQEDLEGRFLPDNLRYQIFNATSETTGTFCNELDVMGLLDVAFEGSYKVEGRIMQLTLKELNIFWAQGTTQRLLLSLDIREGKGIRALVERFLRGGKENPPTKDGDEQKPTRKKFVKRPNTYLWCYADDKICVAQGSKGAVGVWMQVPILENKA